MNASHRLAAPLLLWLAGLSPAVSAEESGQDATSAEHLLFMEVPVVVTASRKEQPVSEAPAAVTVVTAGDIRQSGATTVPDALRGVSGVDVMTITARDQQVGIRGFNGVLNNKLLVLIDGRSVYSDFFGNVYWSLFPVALEEIERIEVIKSPISTLYGANAYSGVINIITRTAKDMLGTRATLTAGSRDTVLGNVIHAGAGRAYRYKISAALDRTDEWEGDARAGAIERGNFQVEREFGPQHSVAVSGGLAHADDMKIFIGEALGSIREKDDYDYLQADYRNAGFKLRAFRKTEFLDQIVERGAQPNEWDVVTYDTEAQYAFSVGNRHAFVVGADARHIALKQNNYVGEDQTQNLWALFGEDEIRIGDKLLLSAGARYDRHPLVKGHLAPRLAVLYTPVRDHTLRLSVTRAFRNPSLLESHLQSAAPAPPFVFLGEGNPDLEPEQITSYEAGYRARFAQRTTLGVDVFYNTYTDQIIRTQEIVFPNIIASFANGADAWGVGGEIELEQRLSERLSVFANYAYQRITDEGDNPYTLSVNERDRVRRDTPRNKVNAGVRARLASGLSASLQVHWVDATQRLIADLDGNEHQAKVDAYTLVNGRIGRTFRNESVEASLAVFNLLNDRHYEYPPGINLPDRSSDRIGRTIAFTVNFEF